MWRFYPFAGRSYKRFGKLAGKATHPLTNCLSTVGPSGRVNGNARHDGTLGCRGHRLCNLLLHDTAQNKVWLEIVQIALDLLAWMPMFALRGKARLWKPRRSRFRLFTEAGQLVTTGCFGLGPARRPPGRRSTWSFAADLLRCPKILSTNSPQHPS